MVEGTTIGLLGYSIYISPFGWVAIGMAAAAFILLMQWPQRAILWTAEKLGY